MNAPNCCQGVILIVDHLGGSGLDIIHSHGLNARKDLGRGHAATVGEQLTADIFGDVGMAIQSHEHTSLEVQFGAFQFFF